jgi:hypothetical protein
MRPPLAKLLEQGVGFHRGMRGDVLDHSVREWDHTPDVRLRGLAKRHVAAERVVCGRLNLKRRG